MSVAQFVSKAVGAHRKSIVKLVSSALGSLELEARAIVKVLRSSKCIGNVSGADSDPTAGSQDPSS